MNIIKKAVVEVGAAKKGTTRGRDWLKHAYRFEKTEGWFVHFVDLRNPPPLLKEGTIVGELRFESGKFGNDIKEMVNVSEPPKVTSPREIANAFEGSIEESVSIQSKQHPFWMLWSYIKDLQLARIERICPFPENKQQAFLSLKQLAEDVSSVATDIYEAALIQLGGNELPDDPTSWDNNEPKQEPTDPVVEPPPQTDDNVPF